MVASRSHALRGKQEPEGLKNYTVLVLTVPNIEIDDENQDLHHGWNNRQDLF